MTSPHDELDQLMSELLEGQLSPSSAARLEELLRTRQGAAESYAELISLHALLQEELHPQRPDVALAKNRGGAAVEPSWRRAGRYFARPVPLSISVAALVMFVFIAAMALVAPPIYQRLMDPADQIEFVARLSRTRSAVWAEGQAGTQLGSRLWIGHRLRLDEGFAELRFDSGSRLLLEGPVNVTLTGPNRIQVTSGKFTAHVPAAAVGFQAETPVVLVTDLGTSFGAMVDDAVTEVTVFEGSVELAPNSRVAPSKLVLLADQSAKVHADARVKVASGSAGPAFTRRMPDPEFWLSADFRSDNYQLGPLAGQQAWQVTSGGTTFELVDAAGARALEVTGAANGYTSRPIIPVSAAGRAALLAEFRAVGEGPYDLSIGLSDRAAPTQFDDFAAQVVVLSGPSGFLLRARNGDRFVPLAENLPTDQWYRVWLVVDNASDTYDVYLAGGANAVPKRVGSALRYRHPVVGQLVTTFIRTGGRGNATPVQFRGFHLVPGEELWEPETSESQGAAATSPLSAAP